jgi:hypothetical protein
MVPHRKEVNALEAHINLSFVLLLVLVLVLDFCSSGFQCK